MSFAGRLAPAVALVLVVLLGWLTLQPVVNTGNAQSRRPREPFASDRDPVPPGTTPAGATPAVPFDGVRAMRYLNQLCDIGPRLSGSPGIKRLQEMLQKHFEALGAKVEYQRFTARQTSRPQPVEMANMVVSFHPTRARRVLLCGHYDTRPIADQEPDPRRWTQPFASANDGTSTAAWMMELAHHVAQMPATVGVDFALFDGEEYVFDARPGADKYFFGSEHFAGEYTRLRPQHRYVAGVLLDLFAAADARYPQEQNSLFLAGTVVEEIWRTAAEVGVPSFESRPGQAINDDHLALNRAGIPTADLIDFSYPHWHRLSDTPDRCSGDQMARVAKVLTAWVRKLK